MASAPGPRSLSSWSVLGVVAEGPTHGFAVAREFEPDAPLGSLWTVPRPLVYRAISELVDAGLLERTGSAPGQAGPRRSVIAVTELGLSELTAWLATPVRHVRDARSELLVKLLLLDRRGDDPRELIAAQRRSIAPMIAGLSRQLHDAQGFDRTVLRWRLSSASALEHFLAELAEQDL